VDYFLHPVSRTFHGRDIFAPVAAHLASGVAIHKLGTAQKDFIRLAWPQPRRQRNRIEGEVVFIDRFGNVITNIENAGLTARNSLEVFIGRKRLCPGKHFYQSVPAGQAVAVPGSSGFWEIAVNGGSAAEHFRLKIGDRVHIRWF
jgi:hypothetical protein